MREESSGPPYYRQLEEDQEFIDLLIQALDERREEMNGWQVQIDPDSETRADAFTVSWEFSVEDGKAVAEVFDAALGERVDSDGDPEYK